MNETKHNEFESLRNRLGEFQPDPPKEVWDYVSRNITGRGRRRNMIILIATAASIVLALSLGFSLRYINKTTRPIHELAQSETPSKKKTAETTQDFTAPHETAKEEEIAETPQNIEEPQNVVAPSKIAADEKTVVTPQNIVAQNDAVLEEETVVTPQNIVAQHDAALEEETVVTPQNIVAQNDAALEEETVVTPQNIASPNEIALEEELQKTKKNHWIISGIISPLYSFRDAGGNLEANNAVSNVESAMIAYAGGVNVGFQPGDRITIESGLMFNKMGINIGEVAGFSGSWRAFDFSPLSNDKMNASVIPVTNSIGNIVSNSGNIFINNYKDEELYTINTTDGGIDGIEQAVTLDGVRENLEFLEIPLNMRYSVVDRSIELQLIGGMSTNFLVNNNVTAETENGTEEIGYVSNVNTVNLSGNAGIGMIYHFHSNFSISLEPRFRYYLNSINDNSLPVTRPYSIGIYTGINYRF